MAYFVIRDNNGNIVGSISEEDCDDYDPIAELAKSEAAAERRSREEKKKEELEARQKPAKRAVGCSLWLIAFIGIELGAGKAHSTLGFSLIGVAIICYIIYDGFRSKVLDFLTPPGLYVRELSKGESENWQGRRKSPPEGPE